MDFAAIPKKAQSVLTKPKEFFDSIKGEKGFNDALVYYAVLSVVGTIPTLAFGIGSAVSMVVMGVIFSFIIAFFVQIFVSLFGGAGKFEETYRSLAYGYTPGIFSGFTSFIPFIGFVVAFGLLIYSVYLSAIGVSKYHGISIGKAAAAIIMPIVIVTFIISFFAGLFMASMMGSLY